MRTRTNFTSMTGSTLRLHVATLLVAVLVATAAQAQVSCANPDNLCTGNPCVIPKIDLACPCVVDFGARTVIVSRVLSLPDACVLSFTADDIEVDASIGGKNPNGSDITLIATNDITSRSPISAQGRLAPGAITLRAGGNIQVERLVRAGGSRALGGVVTLDADGLLTTAKRGKVDVRSIKTETGGQAILHGDSGVNLLGRIDVSGGTGGSVALSSSADITTGHRILAKGTVANGGSVAIDAEGTTQINRMIEARGKVTGGSIAIGTVAGTTTAIIVDDKVNLRVRGRAGGNIQLIAENSITLKRSAELDTRASQTTGGVITVTAPDIAIGERVDIEADGKTGGFITLTASNSIVIEEKVDIDARGDTGTGGIIDIAAGPITIGLDLDILADGDGGGSVAIASSGDISVGERLDIDAGSLLDVSGTSLQIATKADIRVVDFPREMRFLATTGDMTLDGKFDARDSGVIEGLALSGELVAIGTFRAEPSGCIGLSDSNSPDTSAATFDVALSASCP